MVIPVGHDRSDRGKLAFLLPNLLTFKYINPFSTANTFYLMKKLMGKRIQNNWKQKRMKTYFSDCG